MGRPTVVFIFTKVRLNVDICVKRHEFDAYNNSKKYDH